MFASISIDGHFAACGGMDILQERRASLGVATRRGDHTMAIHAQQCVPATVDFQMLAVDVPHLLVGSCKNAAHSHAVNASNTHSCALHWRMKPSAPRTKVTIDLEFVTPSRTTSICRISAKTLGRRYRPSRKTRLETEEIHSPDVTRQPCPCRWPWSFVYVLRRTLVPRVALGPWHEHASRVLDCSLEEETPLRSCSLQRQSTMLPWDIAAWS